MTGSSHRPKVAVLYHYFHPDDVVSARHLTQFCLDLQERGWEVEALPCNRGCRDESIAYPLRESWQGIRVRRIWRPRFRQASTLGRMLNSAWMVAAWCRLGLRLRSFNARRCRGRHRPGVRRGGRLRTPLAAPPPSASPTGLSISIRNVRSPREKLPTPAGSLASPAPSYVALSFLRSDRRFGNLHAEAASSLRSFLPEDHLGALGSRRTK